MAAKKTLNDEWVYTIALKYAYGQGQSEVTAKDFAGWEWEHYRHKSFEARARSVWSVYVDYLREKLGQERDGQKVTSARIAKAAESSGLFLLPRDHAAVTHFEDSDIYQASRIAETALQMPMAHRVVFILLERWGMSVKEIAFVLGVRACEVESMLHKIKFHFFTPEQ